jgi:carbonic anhydrase/acetyltransferase-like protein (isoleucine patch superfamily)
MGFQKIFRRLRRMSPRLIFHRQMAQLLPMDFHQRIARHLDSTPRIHPTAFTAANATIGGDVTLGEESSVWYQCVLRADINRIVIGPRSNIQDGSVVHLADDFGVEVGELVTVGHKAVLHACKVDNEVLIGMGAIVLDGAEIGARSIVGAGAIVTGGKIFPPGSLILGAPAKVVRTLTLDEQAGIRVWADKYVTLSREYIARGIR